MDCKGKKYHNFEVVGVNGTLPYQEVSLVCEECGFEHTVDFEVNE